MMPVVVPQFTWNLHGLKPAPNTNFCRSSHFVRIVRRLILLGTDLFDLIPDLRAPLIFMGVMLTIAVLRFHKRLD